MFEGQKEKPHPHAIEQGWDELSPRAFALWMRMMVVPGWELKQGRQHLIRATKKHRCWVNRYLAELRDKGYIRLEKAPGRATTIVIVLAPMIISPNHFVNFG